VASQHICTNIWKGINGQACKQPRVSAVVEYSQKLQACCPDTFAPCHAKGMLLLLLLLLTCRPNGSAVVSTLR
jgi:hypothetical protein